MVRDKTIHYWNRSGQILETTERNVRDRFTGISAELRARVEGEEFVPDFILAERVRSKLGRVASHPRAIDVLATDGRVILGGFVLEEELQRVLSAVHGLRGVHEVENRLEVHRERDIPALQGGSPRAEYGWEIMQTNWSPSFRLAMTGTGSALAVYGLLRRGAQGALVAGAGAGILTRALTNLELRRIFGLGAGRRAVEVHKTVNINAPVEEVFGFWSHMENFPRFMRHIKEVRDLGNARSHWVAAGPAGISVQWTAVTTRKEDNRMIAWRSEPGTVVRSAGRVHFLPKPGGGTQVDVIMSYNPPAGALGHAVAAIFGADPRHAMNEDLGRLKSLIEDRKTSIGSRTVTKDEVAPRP
jgi:uncharacterized membrane protein